jgi:hypothetical protein
MYGTGADALGRATVRTWAPASIQVQLPTGLAAGSYWLALYNADGQLRSNRLAGLTVRSFTLSPAQPGIVAPAPGPFAPEFFDVAVTLTRLIARESGDSASDGDWIVNFAAHPTGEFPHWVRWPGHSGSQNVGDGSSLGPVGPIRLRVRSDQDIEGFLHILDCDADLIVVHIVAELFADCNGEELYDLVSGAPDAASTRFRLIPAQWQRGAEVRRTESQEGIEYTAHFRVDATPAAP